MYISKCIIDTDENVLFPSKFINVVSDVPDIPDVMRDREMFLPHWGRHLAPSTHDDMGIPDLVRSCILREYPAENTLYTVCE